MSATHDPAAVRAAIALVEWLASLDEPEQADARREVTLTQISNKAREALDRRWSA